MSEEEEEEEGYIAEEFFEDTLDELTNEELIHAVLRYRTNVLDHTDQDRLTAVKEMLWRDLAEGIDLLLFLVVDVNIEGEDRVDVIRVATSLGPPVHLAATWLIEEIEFAFLEDQDLIEATNLTRVPERLRRWWPTAHGLITRNTHLDLNLRVKAAVDLHDRNRIATAYALMTESLPLERLPGALYEANEQDSPWAGAFLERMADDMKLDGSLREDAAEWLTMIEPFAPTGVKLLYRLLRDRTMEKSVRDRALRWLESSIPAEDLAPVLVSEIYGAPIKLTDGEPEEVIREFLRGYRCEFATRNGAEVTQPNLPDNQTQDSSVSGITGAP